MTTRKTILTMAVCALVAISCPRLWSQGSASGGFSGGSGSRGSRSSGTMQRPPRMRRSNIPGRPDFERMRNMSNEERIKYLQEFQEKQRKEMEKQEELSMKQTLGVDDKQWRIIEPKLKKVKHYREQALISIKSPFQSSFTSFGMGPGGAVGGGGAGFGFQVGGSFSGMAPGAVTPMGDPDRPLTDGERIIEELQYLMRDIEPDPSLLKQKMNELRMAREKARQKWVRAQEDLRKVLNLRQEVTLMMMGWLD